MSKETQQEDLSAPTTDEDTVQDNAQDAAENTVQDNAEINLDEVTLEEQDNVEQNISSEDLSALNADLNLDPFTALEAERDDLKDQTMRALAEVENIRRRTERELAQSRKYGHAGFARDLLTAIENLKRAVDALPEDRSNLDEGVNNLVVGVEMVYQNITTILDQHGIKVIDPQGEKFDYEKHQAMYDVPSEDAEPGTVVQVAQRGWMLHDRLLSPAMVGVAKAVETKE